MIGKVVSHYKILEKLSAGQTLLCEGTASARVYDAKGRQVAVVDAQGAIPVLQPGKHEIRFDCKCRGAVAPAAVVTFRTKGEGGSIAATK